jgi:KUP system potassium uptake protein
LVASFQTSSNLAAAYGIAVSGTMMISTFLLFFVARDKWRWPLWQALGFVAFLLAVDFCFFGANALKIYQGGWFPLLVAGIIFTVMTTWRQGRVLLAMRLKEKAIPISEFIKSTESLVRVPGTALFMTSVSDDTPAALVHNVRHNKILHERVILMTVETMDVPHVPREERYEISRMNEDFYRIVVRYGFMDSPNVPAVLTRCANGELDIKLSEITYFLGRETLLATGRPGMAIWRERMFSFMSRNAQRATAFFRIPTNQVIEIGMQVEL